MGTKCTVFTSDKGDVKADLAFFNNYSGTTAPGVSNDTTQGYRRGSIWQNHSVTPVAIYQCVTDTAGAAVWLQIESGSAEGAIVAPAGANASLTGGAPATATSAGTSSSVVGGAGGATSGEGGAADVTGGAASGGNANGGPVVLTGGAANGTGSQGPVIERGVTVLKSQGAAVAHNAAATLAAADMIGGIITSAAVAAIAFTLPLATAIDTALPDAVAGDSFDFSVINTSATAADTVTVGTAAGWTLVGNMIVAGLTAGGGTAGRFRAAKTGAGAWTLYRLS